MSFIRRVVILAFVLVITVTGLFVTSSPAHANDDCSKVLVAGSSWAGGKGVTVRHNGNSHGTGNSCLDPDDRGVYDLRANPPSWGLRWQCVELAARFYMTMGWIKQGFNVMYAANIYNDASSKGMQRTANGHIKIADVQTGDMIVSSDNFYGHVVVVDYVKGNTVRVVEQNASASGRATYSFANGRLSRPGFTISGLVHDPDNDLGHSSESEKDELDANPAIAVGDQGSVYTLQVAIDHCAKIYRRRQGEGGFKALAQVPSSCGWSTAGGSAMAMVPGTDNRAWLAIVKSEGVGGCGELYLYSLHGNDVTNRGEVGLTCGWSINAPPAITVDGDGNVYVAATKGGTLWVFRREPGGNIVNDGNLGDTAKWSDSSGVSIKAAPNRQVWVVAIKDSGDAWAFLRRRDGSWANQDSPGIGDWSTAAQPGLAIDNDGDITVAIVKKGGSRGGVIHSYHRCSGCVLWRYAGQIGWQSQWATSGTLSIDAGPDDRVFLAALKQNSASGTTLWSFVFTPNRNYDGSWSDGKQLAGLGWSKYSAPAIATAGRGSVFLAAVKTDGTLCSLKRSPSSGGWSDYGQIGSNGWAGKAA